MKVRDLKALLETMPGEADVVWQNDDSTEDVIRCESGMYSIVDSVEKITSSRLTQVFCLTMTPARYFAGLRRSSMKQVYQGLTRVHHMPVLSET